MTLLFVGGPWDGRTYPLEKDQVKPLAVYVPESRGGHYILAASGQLEWRGK